MKKLAAILILAALAAAGCPRQPEPPRNYIDSNKHFRLNKPDGWDEIKNWNDPANISDMSLGNAVDVAFLSPEPPPPESAGTAPPAPLPHPPVRAVISVKTYAAPDSGEARALWNREKADIAVKLTGGHVNLFSADSEGEFGTSNGAAHSVQCTWIAGQIRKKGLLVIVTANDRGAIVLCSCEDTDYPKFEETFKRACESFYLESAQK